MHILFGKIIISHLTKWIIVLNYPNNQTYHVPWTISVKAVGHKSSISNLHSHYERIGQHAATNCVSATVHTGLQWGSMSEALFWGLSSANSHEFPNSGTNFLCVGERFYHSIISTWSYQLFKPYTQLAGGPTPHFVIFWLISLLKVSEQHRLCSLKANLAQVALQNAYCFTAGSKSQ